MKKNIITGLIAAALLMTACNSTTNTTAAESETVLEESTVATTSETTEATTTTTEATTESTVDERMLNMTIDEVVAAIKPAYGEEMIDFVDENYDGGEHLQKDAEKGIKSILRFGVNGIDLEDFTNSYFVFIYVIEMDMNSDTYKSLEVGSTISPMVFSQNTGYKEEPNKVCAINGQYVLTCVEMYYQGDELISNFASPFYFENIDNVVKAFEDLKND